MSYFRIIGGTPLHGEVDISGAKNSAVAIIPATILCGEPCTLENVPDIEDVHYLVEIMTMLGARVKYDVEAGIMVIDPKDVDPHTPLSPKLRSRMNSMRGSYYLLGALLGRFGYAKVALPGGCDIGGDEGRPIDLHIKGFEAFSAEVTICNSVIETRATKLVLISQSGTIDASKSVGATINVMLAASRAEGLTRIINAAKEPHVVDVANFLSMMGTKIRGAGTENIRVWGSENQHGCTYSIIPDQIEAGTFMIAAAATHGDVILRDIIPRHLDAITVQLAEAGANVRIIDAGGKFNVRVSATAPLRPTHITTKTYPGFPTDLQQPMTSLLSISNGTSMVTESIYDRRFQHINELRKMGADIDIDGRTAIIRGVGKLTGTDIYATDLRAGASLVVAALMAQGCTNLHNIQYIDRGYDHIDVKLRGINADIVRI